MQSKFMCQDLFHVFLNYTSKSTKDNAFSPHNLPSFLGLQSPGFMGPLWSHLISQGTDTQCLLSIFWLDCRENNLVFQEEQCWLFKGPSSRKPSDSTCKRAFGMEWVLQRRKWGKFCASRACPPEKMCLIVLLIIWPASPIINQYR